MLLIDTETLNTSVQLCWEFAGLDTKTGKLFHLLNGTAIRQALSAKCRNKSLMFFNKYQLTHASQFPWLEHENFVEAVIDILSGYRHITAYNIGFDVRVLNGLGIDLADYSQLDLWGSFVKVIGCTKSYILWCNTHKYLTKTKLPKTDAETAYRYITGKVNYKTPHLAIEDVKHELVIYKAIQKRKKAKHYGNFSFADLKQYYCS